MQQNFIGYCYAMYDYAAVAPNQISLREGDRIGIMSKGGESRGWWKGRNGSQVSKLHVKNTLSPISELS